MSFIRSSVEIAFRNHPPYVHAKFIGESSRCEMTENSFAERTIRRCGEQTEILYKLQYGDEHVEQIKSWMILPFSKKLIVHFKNGNSEQINCATDKPMEDFNGLQYGKHWDRVAMWCWNCNPPLKFDFDAKTVEVQGGQLSHIILYRRNNLKMLELAFIWWRHNIPKDRYEISLKIRDKP